MAGIMHLYKADSKAAIIMRLSGVCSVRPEIPGRHTPHCPTGTVTRMYQAGSIERWYLAGRSIGRIHI